jgi:hypothetical protein
LNLAQSPKFKHQYNQKEREGEREEGRKERRKGGKGRKEENFKAVFGCPK